MPYTKDTSRYPKQIYKMGGYEMYAEKKKDLDSHYHCKKYILYDIHKRQIEDKDRQIENLLNILSSYKTSKKYEDTGAW